MKRHHVCQIPARTEVYVPLVRHKEVMRAPAGMATMVKTVMRTKMSVQMVNEVLIDDYENAVYYNFLLQILALMTVHV